MTQYGPLPAFFLYVALNPADSWSLLFALGEVDEARNAAEPVAFRLHELDAIA